MRDIRECTNQNTRCTRRLNIHAYKSIDSNDSFEVLDFCSDAADRLIGLYGWIRVLSYISLCTFQVILKRVVIGLNLHARKLMHALKLSDAVFI